MINRNRRFRRRVAAAEARSAAEARPPCLHLGDVLPQQTGSCGQRVRRCSEFGTCTVERCGGPLAACAGCERYEPADAP